MKIAYRHSQLYTFLLYCNGYASQNGLKKEILDCGAGGKMPPLGIFAEHGYVTHGIDIGHEQIEQAKEFERTHGMDLGLKKGDMCCLPFADASISFVYSYNSIFHMAKKEIAQVIVEIKRVLPKGGLAFINFASIHDMRSQEGKQVGEGEYLQIEHGQEVLHSYFGDDEPEQFFQGFEVIFKENRIRDGRNPKGQRIRMGFIDYILEKQ